MDDVRVFGYCDNCGDKITDSSNEYYVTDDGKVFCCCECVMEYLGVVKIEV